MTVNFDLVARPYRWLEYCSFGPLLGRCRTALFARLAPATHALVLGDGDGRFLAALLDARPALTADVVDSSRTMLKLLRGRLVRRRTADRACLHHADVLAWTPGRDFDLLVTHFFLDCFTPGQLEDLCDRLLPYARPGTQWIVSEFADHNRLSRIVVSGLYVSFGLLTGLPVRALPDYRALLAQRGFVLRAEQRFLGGLVCSQLWFLPPSPADDGTHSAAKMN